MNKFRLKDGKSLSMYAFACGYVQKAVSSDTIPYRVVICNPAFDTTVPKIELSLCLDGCFHAVLVNNENESREWYSFESVADARKKFKELKRIHNLIW